MLKITETLDGILLRHIFNTGIKLNFAGHVHSVPDNFENATVTS